VARSADLAHLTPTEPLFVVLFLYFFVLFELQYFWKMVYFFKQLEKH